MERFSLTFLFLTFLSSTIAYNCDFITDPFLCSLPGCTWVSGTCTGDFIPTCTIPDCYYIDPLQGSDSGDGSPSNPYQTLTPGFQVISTSPRTLIVINSLLNIGVQILQSTSISSNVAIKQLFPNIKYVLSLENFNLTTLSPTQSSAVFVSSGSLDITGCIMNSKTREVNVSSIFELGNAKLSFTDVDIVDFQGANRVLVKSASDKTSAQFSYTTGKHENSSFSFQLEAGTHSLKDVRFLDNKAQDKLLRAGLTVTMTNILVKGGASLFLELVPESSLTIVNLTMNGYTGNFMDATNTNRFIMNTSKFMNLSPTKSTPFIKLTRPGRSFFNPHSIKDTVFENITVKNSIFLVENNAQRITLDNITMTNIKKLEMTQAETTTEDIEYQGEWPGGICFLGRRSIALTVNNSCFSGISSHCIGLKGSTMAVTSSVFNNSALSYTPTTVSRSSVSDSYGVTWISFRAGANDVTPGSSIRVTSNKFIENKMHPRYGGALRFIGTFTVSLTLSDNEFRSNSALYGGAIYSENPQLVIYSTNDVFSFNTAEEGGAIYKVTDSSTAINSVPLTLTLNNGQFLGNKATTKGGSILLNYEILSLANSSFCLGQAQNGGAIYFLSPRKSAASSFIQSNNTYESNYASNSGGALKLLFDYKDNSLVPSKYINNTDMFGLDISDGKPAYYRFSFYDVVSEKRMSATEELRSWVANSSLTRLSSAFNTTSPSDSFVLNHKSGHELKQIILVEVYDSQNRLANYINSEGIIVSVTETQNNISNFEAFVGGNSVSFSFSEGKLYMKQTVKLVGEPKTYAKLSLQGRAEASDILNDANALLDHKVPVYFTDCEIGDVYNPYTRMCVTCREGTYSLSDPYSNPVCIVCDKESAICLGGSKIAPKPGYWRYDTLSDKFMECPETQACLGGYVNEQYYPQGLCSFPYEGNLCNKCVDDYAKFGSSSKCVNCQTDIWYYIKFSGFFLFQIVALLYSVKVNVSKISEIKKAHLEDNRDIKEQLDNDDFQSNLIKTLINFIQISSIIMQYEFKWPIYISTVVDITNKTVPGDKEGFSVDCLIALVTDDNDWIYFAKLIMNLVQPFLIWFFLAIFYLLYLKFKKQPIWGNSIAKKKLIVLFVITAFLLQPNLIQTTLEIFKCQNFSSSEKPVYFMNENSEIQCWTSTHLIWSLVVALPNFLLWAIVLPLALFMLLRKKAKDLKDPEVYARYSFVYEGLKTEKYYWEFVILIRKILVVVLFVFFNFISIQGQAFATFLVIVLFAFLHYKLWPYSDERLNRAEMIALSSLSLMIYCGMFFLSNGGNQILDTILIILVCVVNLGFFIYLGILFVKSFKKTAKRMVKSITRLTDRLREKFRTTKSQSSNTVMTAKKGVILLDTPLESKGVSIVLNKIVISELPSPSYEISYEIPSACIGQNDERITVPSEMDSKLEQSRTVYKEDKNDIDNYSIMKSVVLRPSIRSQGIDGNSIGTLLNPEVGDSARLMVGSNHGSRRRSTFANLNERRACSLEKFEETEVKRGANSEQQQENTE